MSALCPAILIFFLILVTPDGHCQPLETREGVGHNLVKRADKPPPATTSGGTENKFKFGMGYGGYPYMGYPGYGYGYPGYGYGMPGMGYGYGGGYGGQYGGQYGGSFGGAMGGGMYGR